jgi:hypothetical protein
MPTTLSKIVDGFPHPTVPSIIGIPTYEALKDLQLALNANAASVRSNLGNGLLGLLALTVSPEVHDTLAGEPFVVPLNPGPAATIPDALTGAQIANIRQDHDELKALFVEYYATDKALKQQIIGAVDKLYLRTLNHRITGFANVTTRQMLVHLYTTYGRLTPADVQNNDAAMKQPYNPNEPIETLFHQIEESIDVADAAGAAYTPSQIVAISYNLIFATGMFPEACREWRRRVTNTQTWHNFKADFAAAHQDYRDSQLTSRQSGYQSANNAATDADDTSFDIQGTVDAIANLATATASDRSTVAHLAETNASQNAKIEQQATQLTTARMELATLRSELARLKGTNASSDRTTTSSDRRPRQFPPNTNYCWTHGYAVSRNHTSQGCAGPKEGHQREATRQNNMGGSQRGKT